MKKALLLLTIIIGHNMQAQTDTLRVFILAGQSNMEGFGQIYGDLPNTLEDIVVNDTDNQYNHLINENGDFINLEQIKIRFNREWGEDKVGNLGVSYGANDNFIGPEYGFGFRMTEHLNDPMLIIKTAWGGKSLAVDFRPPSAGGITGSYFTQIIDDVHDTLDNLTDFFPEFENYSEAKLSGFVWFQGWNDGEEFEYMEEYESNLIHFINDMRSALDANDMPFVVANTGIGGFGPIADGWTTDLMNYVVPAQAAAVAHYGTENNVALADTRPYWRDVDQSPDDVLHHWHHNAFAYYHIGNESALAMQNLIPESTAVNIEEPKESNIDIRLYPNPVTTVINVEILNQQVQIPQYRIYNLSGKLIKQGALHEQTIDIADLSAGSYTISLHNTDNNRLLTSKNFVKTVE